MLELFQKEKYWIVLSASCMLLAGFFITGIHFPDEHCQILEFLHIKLFDLDGDHLPWEFHQRMRSWFQVFVYYWPIRAFQALGLENPFGWASFLRMTHAFSGLFANLALFLVFKREIKDHFWKRFLFFLMLFSYFFPYLYTRTSAENFGAFLFCMAFVCWSKYRGTTSAILTGLLFGAAFLARNQLAAMVFFLCLWGLIYKKKSIADLALMTTACFAVIGLGVFIDYWGYGEWHFTPWNYYYENIATGHMARVHSSPWWWYPYKAQQKLLMLIPVLSFLYFWWRYRHHPVTWTTFGLFLFHSLISHKELRYLFPLAPFLPFVLTFTLRDFFCKIEQKGIRDTWRKMFTRAFLGGHGLLYALTIFRPAGLQENYLHYLYKNLGSIKKIYHRCDSNHNQISGFPTYFYHLPNTPYVKISGIEHVEESAFYFFALTGKEFLEMKEVSWCREVHPGYNSFERFFKFPLVRRNRKHLYTLFYCER